MYLVLAFLPFHNAPVFPTMLSLISEDLSPTLRFLHPYVQALAKPPRHAIVHAASTNRQFFTALSAFVLDSGHLGFQNPTLVSFWASVATEAVAAMLDQGRSARREAQKQNQEDIVRFLLPVLNDGLSVDNVPDLRMGCYMILTILASKASLDDGVLSVMMEAITSDWSQTSHAGLICLGVLAEQKRTAGLPGKTFEAVIALERLDDDLLTLNKQYKIDKLVLGVALGIISRLRKARDTSGLRLLRTLMEANVMSDASIKAVVKSVIYEAQTTAPNPNPGFDVQGSLADLVLMCDSKDVGAVIHSTMEESNFDLKYLGKQTRLRRVNYSKESTPEQLTEDVDMENAEGQMTTGDFETVMSRIPTRTAYEISFLSHSDSYVYGSLAHAFLSIYTSTMNLERFSNLPVLRKSLGMTEPLFLSFFVRIWCGHCSATARTAAIRTVVEYLRKETLTADVQMLLPYILYALADTSPSVRRAAAELVLVLAPAYKKTADKENKSTNRPILGQQQIYGQGGETQAVTWLSNKETDSILDLMVPDLEECMLDESHVSQLLSHNLNGPKHSKGSNITQRELKKSLRLALLSSICSHVVNTPLYAVKSRLLQMLNQVPKVGSISRTKLLLPLLLNTLKQGQHDFERICDEERLVSSQLLDRLVSIVIPGDRDGIQTLKSIIEPLNNLNFPSLRAAALRRLQITWEFIKIDLQSSLAKALFESAVGNVEAGANGNQDAESMETLRTLPLSTATLRSFVENVPSILPALQDGAPVLKRKRTSHGHSNDAGALDERNLASAIRQITFVLELVGDAKTERHPELLGGLSQIMCDLQQSRSHPATATSYLQVLAIEGMLAIVKRAEVRIR